VYLPANCGGVALVYSMRQLVGFLEDRGRRISAQSGK